MNDKQKDKAIKRLDARSTDIRTELDRYIKLAQHARECLENSFNSGMGHKQMGLSETDLKGLSNLSIALDRIVASKIKYDKHMKSFAEQMTPEEELAAIEEHVMSLERDKRSRWLKKIITRHNNLNRNETKTNMDEVDVYDE